MRRFTADAAHELRTPLAVLRNEAEVTLRAGRSEDDYRRVLENQLEEIARLTRLADQLLFLCREDAGLAAARSEPVRIDLLLIELVERLQVAAQARGVLLEPAVIPECTVASDSDRLRRLFFNLLDNALKYTPAGGRVRVLGRIVGENLEVRVEDSGIGVSSDNLPHLFERFFRVDPARNGESGGSGLGLAICRAIVEAHRGQICAESAAAGGLRMIVTLPARPSEEPPVPAAASNRSDPSRRIARIPDEAPVHSVTM
jgi:signal transduction histidine kinase